MEYTIVVAVRERTDGDKDFLMARHTTRGWELPGGKLEGEEGPVHCAFREFREETGHLLKEPKYVFKLDKDNGTCHVFTGTVGEKVEGAEDDESIVETAWFHRLPEADLAFPNDPYDKMGEALGIKFQ
jgi:8-oxo-dGTP pyrophosphatase MutT (NUDIX family)